MAGAAPGPSPALGRARANPVAFLVGCDLVAAALAAVVWMAVAPGASLLLAVAALAGCPSLLALKRAYAAPFPRPIGAALPAACLGLAPAMAGPSRPDHGPVSDALAPLLWLTSLIVIAAGIGRIAVVYVFFGRRADGRFALRAAMAGGDPAYARAAAERLNAEGGRLLGYAASRRAGAADGRPCLSR